MHTEQSAVVLQACGALQNFTANSKNNTTAAGKAGAVDAVSVALAAHLGDAAVVVRACGALVNLSSADGDNAAACLAACAVDSVVKALRGHLRCVCVCVCVAHRLSESLSGWVRVGVEGVSE